MFEQSRAPERWNAGELERRDEAAVARGLAPERACADLLGLLVALPPPA
jgi:hypothetical protein